MTSYLRSIRPVQLRLLAAISLHGKLRIAADSCNITVPAASRMLADIEAKLDTTLFERSPQGMIPTPAGNLLIHHAKKLVHDVDQMAQDFSAHLGGQAGSVHVGAVTGGALAAVIPAILALKQEAPMVDVTLDVSSSSRLMWGLDRGEYDFTLSRLNHETYAHDFEISPGRTESVLFMVRGDHPLARKIPISLADLLDFPWTMQDRGAPIRHALEIAFHDQGIALPVNLIKTASVVAIMALLRDSEVIAVVTREVSALLLAPPFSADLALLPVDLAIEIEPYHILRPRNRSMPVAAERLLDLIRAQLNR